MRVNRFLSQAGLGSRRAVEEWVRAGRVRVNGDVITDLSRRIVVDKDRVEVDGEIVQARAPHRLLLYHKPSGVVCSMRQQDSRPCLANVLEPALFEGQRLFYVGRLDADSSGLLLLSDDGDLAQAIERPSGAIVKSYRVWVDRELSELDLETLRNGSIVLDGRPCRPAEVEREGSPQELRMRLREGRNRQIRRMLEALGVGVVTLHRTRIGPLELGELPAGQLRDASASEISQIHEAARPKGSPSASDAGATDE